MGYIQPDTATKKRKIPYVPICPHLPALNTAPTVYKTLPCYSLLCCPANHSFEVYSVNFYLLCSALCESFYCPCHWSPPDQDAPHLGEGPHPIKTNTTQEFKNPKQIFTAKKQCKWGA